MATGALMLGVGSRLGAIQPVAAAEIKVRMTMGLRATVQSIPWIGTEAGIFRKHGLLVEFPALEVGGLESAAGLIRGDWEFSQTGTVPVVEEVLKGNDPVILLRNALPHVGIFVMTRREFTSLQQLDGRKVGVLTNATSGQAGINTRLAVEQAGATASYVGLGTFQNIYAALAAGEIDAGAMPVDLRFLGETEHGWYAFPTSGLGLPSILATTRRRVREDGKLVLTVVRAVVETIHVFKTRPDIVVPLTWPIASFRCDAMIRRLSRQSGLSQAIRAGVGPRVADMSNSRTATRRADLPAAVRQAGGELAVCRQRARQRLSPRRRR